MKEEEEECTTTNNEGGETKGVQMRDIHYLQKLPPDFKEPKSHL